MSFASLLDSFCDVKEETVGTPDGAGGYGPSTWSIIYRKVPCCWETFPRKLELLAYDKTAVIPDFYVYMEFRSRINERCRLVKDGKEYDVKLVENTKFMDELMKLSVTELMRGES